LAYTVTLLIVALVAFVSANNLMFLILAAMLSTFMISGFISRLGLAGLELELFLPSTSPPGEKFARESGSRT